MIPILAAAGATTAEAGVVAAKAATGMAKTVAEISAVAAKTGGQAAATVAQTANAAEKAVATSGVNATNAAQTLAPQATQGGNAASLEQAAMAVLDAEGNAATGVFPKFESSFDAQLPKDMLTASDKEQFTECSSQLKDSVSNNSELAKQFSNEQLEQILNCDTPDGYTWHHNEELGRMQLVKSDIHSLTGHTGGRSIWGGGSEFRA